MILAIFDHLRAFESKLKKVTGLGSEICVAILTSIVSKFTASRAQNLRGGKWPVPLAAASKRATRKKS